MLKRLLFGGLVGAMALAACGGGDDGGASNEYSDALAESFRSDVENPFTDDQIDCLAVQFVADLGGPSRFEDAGVTPDEVRGSSDITELDLELSEAEGRKLADSLGECDISIVELLLTEAGPDVDEATATCVQENIDEDALKDYFAVTFVSDDAGEPPAELLEPIISCFSAGG